MEIPPHILTRLRNCDADARIILNEAKDLITDFDHAQVGFKVTASAPLPLMPIEIQAQSLTFIIRFDHLPEIESFVAGRHPNSGRFYLNEIDTIRAALNEYRTIFYNEKDGIYYNKITSLYQQAFLSEPVGCSMRFKAIGSDGVDRSVDFLKHLKSRKRAIQHTIKRSDFNFIYNGVLQHSDARHSRRMINAYTDGSLAYTLLKNFILARGMKEFLREHYRVINTLNFPVMGSL
jgi:hypothetical protein